MGRRTYYTFQKRQKELKKKAKADKKRLRREARKHGIDPDMAGSVEELEAMVARFEQREAEGEPGEAGEIGAEVPPAEE